MRINLLFFLLLSIVLVKSCKYWCKVNNHRYYCCPNGKSESWSEHGWHSLFFPWFWLNIKENNDEPNWQEFMLKWKPEKECPPLRPNCPRTYGWYKPPSFCDSDHDCDKWEKCCYDVCLDHKTCKDVE